MIDPGRGADARSNRALVVVFALLVVMTAVAAFAIGGLFSLRSSMSDRQWTATEDALAGVPLAVALGEVVAMPSLAREPLLTPSQPRTGDAIQPPLVGLTPAASGTAAPLWKTIVTPAPSPPAPPAAPQTTPTPSPLAPSPPAPSPSCTPTAAPPAPNGSGAGAVPVLPLCS